jgi:hypothetical protein
MSAGAYVSHRSDNEKSIFWTSVSFSKLWRQLADVNISEDRFDNAAVCIEKRLELEPDHRCKKQEARVKAHMVNDAASDDLA